MLHRFKVIFDYSRKRLILESNRRFVEPEEYDMSGIDLIAEGPDFKSFKVRAVTENSPASAAGLLPGDLVLSLNGKTANAFTLDEIQTMFKREGREYLLAIRRGEKRQRINIKLRRLI